MTNAVFCADIGTSSLKAAFVTENGIVLEAVSESIDYRRGSDRWLHALAEAAFSLHKALDRRDEPPPHICAISISGNGPSLANEEGSYLWNEPYTEGEPVTQVLALDPGFSLFLPRILHVKHCNDDMWNCPTGILSVPEYLVYQLTGNKQTLLPDSRYTHAYWDEERCLLFGIPPQKLPPFVEFGETAGTLLPAMAEKIHLGQHYMPPVFCGGPDFTIALIGTNTLEPGKICDRAGSSEGINLCTASPLEAAGIRTLPSPVAPLWNASVLIPDSGSRFTDWKYENLYADMPYRTCVSWLMQHQESDGYELLLDIAFGVQRKLVHLLTTANQAGISPYRSMTCTGGQAKNTEWLQMKADIMGLPIKVSSCADAEITGNAICALYGLGHYDSITSAANDLVHTDMVYYPDKTRRERYQQQYADYIRRKSLVEAKAHDDATGDAE